MALWEVYGSGMDAALHLALDELLFARARKGQHTLLLPEYARPMLVLSHDQHVLDYIGNGAIEYTRSFTPGGAMLCDEKVLPFTIAVPRSVGCTDYRKDAKATHQHFGGVINRILQQSFGVHDTTIGEQFYIKVKRSPRNLPLVGTSQRMENDAQLYHGIITLERWDADYLRRIIRLRTRGEVDEYEKIKELPYVRAYAPLQLEALKASFRREFAHEITGMPTIAQVPADLLSEAENLAAAVYRNDVWRNNAQHPRWSRLSCERLQEGLGFCLLGSEFT